MAHFAKISEENIVLAVHVVADEHCTNKDGVVTTVDKTFGYKKASDGKVRIVLHHSSLPYQK